MVIDAMQVAHFRNLSASCLLPCQELNILMGENGQGKTNWLEAIWLCTGARSFRGCQTKELVTLGYAGNAVIENQYTGFGRSQTMRLTLGAKKTYEQNKVKKPFSKVAGEFFAVAFTPDHLSLINLGPEVRRRFLDATLCQFKPAYLAALGNYQKALGCKNNLLKKMEKDGTDLFDQMLPFELIMAQTAALMIKERTAYLKKVQQVAADYYAKISGEKETFSLRYLPGVKGQTPEEILDLITQVHGRDVAVGYQTRGVHKDDIEFLLDGHEAKKIASQGQRRSMVLALKLAEADLLEQETGEAPVVLLDDVLSELDEKRQSFLLNQLGHRQLFITLCDPTAVLRVKRQNHRLFCLQNGCITMKE